MADVVNKCTCGVVPSGSVVERNGRVMHFDCALKAAEERADLATMNAEESCEVADDYRLRAKAAEERAERFRVALEGIFHGAAPVVADPRSVSLYEATLRGIVDTAREALAADQTGGE